MQLAERIKTLAPRVAAVVSLTFAVAGCVILAGGPSYLRSLVAALPADGAEGDAARRFAGDLVAIFGLPLGVGVYGTLTRAPSRRIWSLFAALMAALAIADATILSMRGSVRVASIGAHLALFAVLVASMPEGAGARR